MVGFPGLISFGMTPSSFPRSGASNEPRAVHQRTFTFDYDAAGNLIGQYTPNGTTTTIDVDTAGAVANIAHAGADGISGDFARFEYTRDANRQVTATVSTGVPTEPSSFSYDALNQLTATTIGTTSASYQYDPADNVTRLLDQTAQHFDPANQLQSTTSPITSVSSTSLTDQASTTMVVPFSGTAGDQVLLWVTTPATESVAATPSGYTALGTWTQGNTKAHLYRHAISSSTDQSVTIDFTGLTGTYTKSATAVVYRGVDPTAPIDDLQAATTTGTSVTLPSVTGSLDNTSEVIFAGTHTPDLTTEPGTWTVTDATPRAAAEPPIGVASAVFDQDQLDAGPTSPWLAENTVGGDLIGVAVALKPARVTYNYDQRGNRITKTSPADTTTYTYDAADRLTAIDDTIAYSYNGDGLRVSKTVDDTTTDFVWSTNATMPLLLAENDTYYVYGPGNQVLEAIDPTPAIEYLGGMNLSITDTPTAAVPVPAVNKRDLIILATVIPTDQTATTPDGYTLLDTTISGNTKTIAWTRIATDSEPTTVNVDYSTGVYDKAIGIAAWRHVDPDNPIETTTSTTATGTDTITTGTGTASNQWGNQAILIAGITSNANHYGTSGWTEPADMTARPTGINASNTELLFADAAVSNGTVGSYTTTNINTGDLTATLVVLNHARPPGRFYHADQLGSIRATTNEYAEITTTRSYDPYGRDPSATTNAPNPNGTGTTVSAGGATITLGGNTNGSNNTTASGPSGFGYAGQYTDTETGFTYLRARYYDPTTAQFLTRDPAVALTQDPYAYAMNNPVNATDPTGLCGFLGDGPCTPGGIRDDIGDLCIDTGGNDQCDTIAEKHPAVEKAARITGDIAAATVCVVGGLETAGAACVGATALVAGANATNDAVQERGGAQVAADLILPWLGLGLGGLFEAAGPAGLMGDLGPAILSEGATRGLGGLVAPFFILPDLFAACDG